MSKDILSTVILYKYFYHYIQTNRGNLKGNTKKVNTLLLFYIHFNEYIC